MLSSLPRILVGQSAAHMSFTWEYKLLYRDSRIFSVCFSSVFLFIL